MTDPNARPNDEAELVDPDGVPISVGGATIADQLAKIAELQAVWAGRVNRLQFIEAMQDAIDSLTTTSWDFIDNYTPFVVPGSQQGSLLWPQYLPPVNTGNAVQDAITNLNRRCNTLDDRIEILRWEATRTAVHKIKIARALEVVLAVLTRPIERDSSIVPPPDR